MSVKSDNTLTPFITMITVMLIDDNDTAAAVS